MLYNVVGCGGTFDHLHAGHKAFLRFAFSHGKRVLVGLTTDSYVKKNKNKGVSSYDVRKKELENFLREEGLLDASLIMPIDSVFGPAIDPNVVLDALVVTEETVLGAKEINTKRHQEGMPEIPVLIMPLVKKDHRKISSSRIREGVINKEGNLFVENSMIGEMLLLPQSLREMLQEPFGILFPNFTQAVRGIDQATTAVVGDATTVLFHKNSLYPKVSIIDFSVGRKRAYYSLEEEGFLGKEKRLAVTNPPGTISPDLWGAIGKAVEGLSEEGDFVIAVDGEEDLAVLPLVLFLPLGFTVFYGQPGKGLVKIFVDLDVKERVKRLLGQFKRA